MYASIDGNRVAPVDDVEKPPLPASPIPSMALTTSAPPQRGLAPLVPASDTAAGEDPVAVQSVSPLGSPVMSRQQSVGAPPPIATNEASAALPEYVTAWQ